MADLEAHIKAAARINPVAFVDSERQHRQWDRAKDAAESDLIGLLKPHRTAIKRRLKDLIAPHGIEWREHNTYSINYTKPDHVTMIISMQVRPRTSWPLKVDREIASQCTFDIVLWVQSAKQIEEIGSSIKAACDAITNGHFHGEPTGGEYEAHRG